MIKPVEPIEELNGMAMVVIFGFASVAVVGLVLGLGLV